MTQLISSGMNFKSSSTLDAEGASNIAVTLNVTPGMLAMLEQISRDSHQPLEVVFTRAIALYRAVLQAEAEGKHVGYATSPEGLEVEFTGIAGPGGESG